jgi:hypothetical protein
MDQPRSEPARTVEGWERRGPAPWAVERHLIMLMRVAIETIFIDRRSFFDFLQRDIEDWDHEDIEEDPAPI